MQVLDVQVYHTVIVKDGGTSLQVVFITIISATVIRVVKFPGLDTPLSICYSRISAIVLIEVLLLLAIDASC